MTTKQKKCAYMMVYTTKTQREIAKELNVNEVSVSRWKQSKEFKDELLRVERQYLKDLTSISLKTMKDLLVKGHSEHVKYLVSSDILNRTGHKPVEKSEISANINPGKLDDLLNEIKED